MKSGDAHSSRSPRFEVDLLPSRSFHMLLCFSHHQSSSLHHECLALVRQETPAQQQQRKKNILTLLSPPSLPVSVSSSLDPRVKNRVDHTLPLPLPLPLPMPLTGTCINPVSNPTSPRTVRTYVSMCQPPPLIYSTTPDERGSMSKEKLFFLCVVGGFLLHRSLASHLTHSGGPADSTVHYLRMDWGARGGGMLKHKSLTPFTRTNFYVQCAARLTSGVCGCRRGLLTVRGKVNPDRISFVDDD
jgi:hypothetical protein